MDSTFIDALAEGDLLYNVQTGHVVEVVSPSSEVSPWLLVKPLDSNSTMAIDAPGLFVWEHLDIEKMLETNPKLKAIVKIIMWRLEKSETSFGEIISLLTGA